MLNFVYEKNSVFFVSILLLTTTILPISIFAQVETTNETESESVEEVEQDEIPVNATEVDESEQEEILVNATDVEDTVVVTANVTDVDMLPPVILTPENIAKTVTDKTESVNIEYSVNATDDVDGNLTPTCDPPSGSLFPVGTTTVSCTVTDSAGNIAEESFAVTVLLEVSPRFEIPSLVIIGIVAAATAIGGAVAIFKFRGGGGTSKEKPIVRNFCGGCGSTIDPNYKFCRKCGRTLPEAQVSKE